MPGTEQRDGPPPSDIDQSADGQNGLYPIRTVSALTGVNPVTLRAWERRYGLIRPQRTPKGHRLYTETDIQRVHRVLELMKQGVPISQSQRLLESAAERQRAQPPSASAQGERRELRQRLRVAISDLDEEALEATYGEALALFPADTVMDSLVLPLLEELGDSARSGDPAARAEQCLLESFVCVKVAARLHHASGIAHGPRLLLAGLPGHAEYAGLLLLALAARRHGYRTSVLGTNVDLATVRAALAQSAFRGVVLLAHESPDGQALEETLHTLRAVGSASVFVVGRLAERAGERIEAAGAIPLAGAPAQAMDLLYTRLGRPGDRAHR